MTVKEKISFKHIEERLDRLDNSLNERFRAERDEILVVISGNDLRYQQRFEAQGKALDAAFGAAKGAVDAALAGADKAAVKTELSADKRFADLGDLIREQFKGMNEKLESLSARVKVTEDRLNLTTGEAVGTRTSKEDTKSLWALGVSLIAMLLTGLALLLA